MWQAYKHGKEGKEKEIMLAKRNLFCRRKAKALLAVILSMAAAAGGLAFVPRTAEAAGITIQTKENALQSKENAMQREENAVQTEENAVQTEENALQTEENALQVKENASQVRAFQDSPFQHPGLLHTEEGFAKIKENIDNHVSPNKETWDQLYGNTYSNPNWNPRPLEYVTRGGRDSINQLRIDIRRAYQNALVWKISGSAEHGAAACRIINAWSSVMKGLGGNADRFLAAGV